MSHVSSALYGEHTITNRRKRWRNNKRSSSWQVVRVWASTRLPGTSSRTRFSVRFRQESSPPFRIADTPRFFDREANDWKDGETMFYDVAVKNARFRENVMASLMSPSPSRFPPCSRFLPADGNLQPPVCAKITRS